MINIQDIIPLMKDGWVAMDKDGRWCWYSDKPKTFCGLWLRPTKMQDYTWLICFDIAPADDWTKSLINVGEK
jgi:hypothetical protein